MRANRRIGTRSSRARQSSQYDRDGNLTQFTAPRCKVTVYQYDGLNRRTFAGFGKSGSTYQSSISYTWDGGDRMTQAMDSIAGAISRTYDGLDDLLSETTPPGSISYQYDLGKRRTAMTVAGQPAVSYAWDNANHLTGITQSGTLNTTSVGFAYDNANRRTSLTLPNGIVLSYAYDNDSRVTAMSWMNGAIQVGDLEYLYDADGHVVEKTGSLASTGIPSAVSGNAFNLANEMTAFNGTPLTYDLDGNLLNDATNTYTWDARNHLSTLTGSGTLATSASFIYDAVGRRLEKTINQQTTVFLYDRLNPVQELVPSGLGQFVSAATTLPGLGIDEFFQRNDVNGVQSFVTDALGSTLALANAAGSISTSYTYEPFGNVSISPLAPDTNPYQFTGRENDATGLYYYRARYYNARLGRFASEDPLFRKSLSLLSRSLRYRAPVPQRNNLFAYALDDPVGLRDPLGLQSCKGIWVPVEFKELGAPVGDPVTGSAIVCLCYWGCLACDGSLDLYNIPENRPWTTGLFIETTGGTQCLCPPPGPQTGCRNGTCGQ
jgi:RHS repeat-associated protein